MIRTLSISIILSLTSGCITMNNCHYCHEDKHPEYTETIYKEMGDGIRRETKWRGWVHYNKSIPQPNKNVEIFKEK